MTPAKNTPEAWNRLKQLYPDDTWFGGVHLEENKPRLRRMLADVTHWHPPGAPARLVDVGCYNGFLCYLFGQLGHETVGIDALGETAVPERPQVLAAVGARYFESNFNALDPFAHLPVGNFDVAILGEVIEHILNHPVGFARAIGGLLKPGGRLVVTTPNPLTLANAWRVLRGRSTCWGDHEFAAMPKQNADGGLISFEGIHYREYSVDALLTLLREAGFSIESHAYLSMGVSRNQSIWKRAIKSLPGWRSLERSRLFGMSHYVVARWNPQGPTPTRR